jgi:hypothetical protein
MPMRRRIYDPLPKDDLAEIYRSWQKNDPDAYKWIGRLVKEIEQLHKRAEELQQIYFLSHGVEVEQVTPEQATRIYDEAVSRRERRLTRV